MKTIYVISILCCFLIGCRAKKELTVSRQETVQSSLIQNDTNRQERFISQLQNRQILIKHLQFSPPDSLDRQYVQSITAIRTEEETQQNGHSILQQETSSKALSYMELRKHEYEQSEIKRNFPLWPVFILLFLVVFGMFLMIKRRKNLKIKSGRRCTK